MTQDHIAVSVNTSQPGQKRMSDSDDDDNFDEFLNTKEQPPPPPKTYTLSQNMFNTKSSYFCIPIETPSKPYWDAKEICNPFDCFCRWTTCVTLTPGMILVSLFR